MFSVTHITFDSLFTARKRGLRRLCFHMCLSVHRGSVCLWSWGRCGDRHPQADTPLGRHPPGQTPLGKTSPADSPGRHLPQADTSPRQTPPPGRHPPGRHPPGRHPPWANTPPPPVDGQQADGTHPTGTHTSSLYVSPNTYNFDRTFPLDYRFVLCFTELFLRKTNNPKCSNIISSVTFLSCSTFA